MMKSVIMGVKLGRIMRGDERAVGGDEGDNHSDVSEVHIHTHNHMRT
jgi:hypothetical protein